MITSINEDSPTASVETLVETNTAIEMEDLEYIDEDFRKQAAKSVTPIPAIEMTDVYKRYGQNCASVLNGLDLKKCHSQKIYVLYGAIKSGKSTVMRIILNLCKTDHGNLTILGNNMVNRSVTFGYMPQRKGLDPYLTIYETVKFYGTLKGMNQPAIMTKMKQLRNALGICNLQVPVACLQEHQQRILGFLIASMSNPDILVLDEPTSGCDPIYKNFIWHHIKLLVNDSNTTVIMTASDCAECMHADIMGYLRDGKLLVEDAPSVLFERFSINNIQRLVYCVAFVDTKYAFPVSSSETITPSIDFATVPGSNVNPLDEIRNEEPNEQTKRGSDMRQTRSEKLTMEVKSQQPSMRVRLQTLIIWNVMLIIRNIKNLSLQTVLPLIALVVYFYAINGNVDSVDLAAVEANLKAGFGCSSNHSNIEPATSVEALCQIFDLINLNADQKSYLNSTNPAEEHRQQGLILEIITSTEATSNLSPELNSQLDATLKTLSTIFSGVIHDAQKRYKNTNNGSLTDDPILKTNLLVDNTAAVRLIWGAIAVITHFCGTLLGALPLANKSKRQINDQLRVLGVKEFEMQLVHWMSRMSLAVVQNFLINLCVMFLLNNGFGSCSFALSWLVIMGQTACGFAFGIFLYTVLNRAANILLAAIVMELLAAIISGFFWKYSALAPLFQTIGSVLPHFAVSEALHAIIIKDLCVKSKIVQLGFAIPSFWSGLAYICHLVANKFLKY